MKSIPHYTKILTLGSAYTENALIGEVIVQEKIDGSQFRFGINEDKELIIGSKNKIMDLEVPEKMFKKGVEYLLSIKNKLLKFPCDTYFIGEYLEKPKHNVLCYERVPKNNIILFDVLLGGKWIDRPMLLEIANNLDIEVIPELYRGDLIKYMKSKNEKGYSSPLDYLKRIIEITPSVLGKELIEGVVIKNYNQTILLGGKIFPLFTKYVRESFKERHETEWKIKSPKNSLMDYIDGFNNEARWNKAIIHLKEQGILTNSPKDIGKIIATVQQDIKEEETENIKLYLYNHFIKDILRKAVKGIPEWYKEKLIKDNIK